MHSAQTSPGQHQIIITAHGRAYLQLQAVSKVSRVVVMSITASILSIAASILLHSGL
jgi:hypothetical protein